MGESFEHTVTVGAWGGEQHENTLSTQSSQIQNTGYINDDTENFKGNKTEFCIDEIPFLFSFFLHPVNIV